MDGQRRVVVTGMGVVTPIGIGVDEFKDALIDGRNGIGCLDPDEYKVYSRNAKNIFAIAQFRYHLHHQSRCLYQTALESASESIMHLKMKVAAGMPNRTRLLEVSRA